MRNCTECEKGILCDQCGILVDQKKEISVNRNELKREARNEFCHMLPKYITT